MKIAEVMTKDVVVVGLDTSLKEVARLLSRGRISGLPVVDATGAVLGVVSEADIIAKERGPEPRRHGLLGRVLAGNGEVKLEARTAGEAMTSPAITVRPESELAEAARVMTGHAVNRLPVVDSEGALLGIVTRADLVRAFLRSDAEIERELREDVILGALWIDPKPIEITVRDGDLTLAGEVDTETDARLLEAFAARIPGVVSVSSNLAWRRQKPRLERSQPYIPIAPRR